MKIVYKVVTGRGRLLAEFNNLFDAECYLNRMLYLGHDAYLNY